MSIPGTAGTPDPPPGYAIPDLPGVAAGSSLIIRGRLVIVSGPAGAVVGMFVYAPGTTPGAGNPPVISITESATDPFGNAVAGGVVVGIAPNAQVQLQSSGGVGRLIFPLNSAGFVNAQISSAIIGSFGAFAANGPASTVANFKDFVGIELNSSDGVSSSANIELLYNDSVAVPVAHNYLAVDFTGVRLPAVANITATAPGTGTSALNPATGESWHDMRPLSNLFVGTNAGLYPPQYRKSPDGFVDIAGWIKTPPTTGNYNSVVFATLPAAYRPTANSGHGWLVSGSADGAASPKVTIDINGNLFLNFLPASLVQTQIGIYGRYPLDNTGLIQS